MIIQAMKKKRVRGANLDFKREIELGNGEFWG